jgi:hypothetical protein
MTTRGMAEQDFAQVADFLQRAVREELVVVGTRSWHILFLQLSSLLSTIRRSRRRRRRRRCVCCCFFVVII